MLRSQRTVLKSSCGQTLRLPVGPRNKPGSMLAGTSSFGSCADAFVHRTREMGRDGPPARTVLPLRSPGAALEEKGSWVERVTVGLCSLRKLLLIQEPMAEPVPMRRAGRAAARLTRSRGPVLRPHVRSRSPASSASVQSVIRLRDLLSSRCCFRLLCDSVSCVMFSALSGNKAAAAGNERRGMERRPQPPRAPRPWPSRACLSSRHRGLMY